MPISHKDSKSRSILRVFIRDISLALETDVLTIETANQPGILAKIAERLAEAEVNIEYTYLAGSREEEKGLIILRPSDVEKARRALEKL